MQIADAGPSHKYRTEIPNTIIKGLRSRGLSIHAKWLYVYLKSIAGDGGVCRQGTRMIATLAGLSVGQVSTAKAELSRARLITISSGKRSNRDSDHITIVDIWLANMQEFSGLQVVNTDEKAQPQISSVQEQASVQVVNTKISGVQVVNTSQLAQNTTEQGRNDSGVHVVNTETSSVHTAHSGVHTVNSGVHVVNTRRSLEEEPILKKDNSLPSGESFPGSGKIPLPDPPPPDLAPVATPTTKQTTTKPLAPDDWLWQLLLEYADTLDTHALNDDKWWTLLSQPLEGRFTRSWLNRAFGKIGAYLEENKAKRPHSSKGWKRFVRTWLIGDAETDRRRTPGKGKTYAAQN